MPIPFVNETDVSEPQVTPVIDWKPADGNRAESSADQGELQAAADLCERVLADDRGAGVINQRASIVRLPLSFIGGSPEAVKRLEDEGDFWRIVPAEQLQQLQKWHALLGLAMGRLSWVDEDGKPRLQDGYHLPVTKAWSTCRHLNYDYFGQRWQTQVGRTGRLEQLTPGVNGWLLWQMASDRPWALGQWRACRVWLLLKLYAIRDMARFGERQGQGTVVVKAPKARVDTTAKRKRLVREIKQMGANGVIALPPDFDFSIVESVARNQEIFTKQIDAANAGIAIAIVGQNLTSEVKSGAYASARVHQEVSDTIIATDAEALSDFVHDQILVPWAIANWGTADAAPWPVWDITPPEDDEQRVASWDKTLDVVAKCRAEGVPADVEKMCEMVQLPLLAGQKVEPPEPQEPTEPEPGDDTDANDRTDGQATDSQAAARGQSPPPPIRCAAVAYRIFAERKRAQKLGRSRPSNRRAQARRRSGERAGQEYADRVAESLQDALATDLAPHLDRMVEIVRNCRGDYDKARRQLVELYADMDPGTARQAVRAGLTMAQVGGWAAVRKDAPELG